MAARSLEAYGLLMLERSRLVRDPRSNQGGGHLGTDTGVVLWFPHTSTPSSTFVYTHPPSVTQDSVQLRLPMEDGVGATL